MRTVSEVVGHIPHTLVQNWESQYCSFGEGLTFLHNKAKRAYLTYNIVSLLTLGIGVAAAIASILPFMNATFEASLKGKLMLFYGYWILSILIIFFFMYAGTWIIEVLLRQSLLGPVREYDAKCDKFDATIGDLRSFYPDRTDSGSAKETRNPYQIIVELAIGIVKTTAEIHRLCVIDAKKPDNRMIHHIGTEINGLVELNEKKDKLWKAGQECGAFGEHDMRSIFKTAEKLVAEQKQAVAA